MWTSPHELFFWIACLNILVTVVFAVTLSVFPAVTALTLAGDGCEGGWGGLFVPTLFVLFNSCDYVGRVAAGRWRLIRADRLVRAALLRVVFVPLMCLCRVKDSSLPVVFGSVAFPLVFMVLFALSNGYVSTLAMMDGPALVPATQMEVAGATMVLCLCLGLLAGSGLSFGVLAIVKHGGGQS